MEKQEINVVKKILKLLWNIIYNFIIVLCIILIAIIFMQKITESNKSIGGYRIFRVISGSMVPKYDIGEVVICKDTNIENIKVGDAIIYKGNINETKNKTIMHEVVNVRKNDQNKTVITAKGLTNNVVDPDIYEEQIYGVVKYKSKILTILYKLATSKVSSFIIITALAINVFVAFNSERKYKIENKIEEKVKDDKIKKNEKEIVKGIEAEEETEKETEEENIKKEN